MRKLLLVLLPAAVVLAGCARSPASVDDPDAIGMDRTAFLPATKTIAKGETLTFANTSSRSLHILVPGWDAKRRHEEGAPSFGGASGHRSEVGDTWTTPAWDRPGTYHVTCTLHPAMNLVVTVTER